MQIGVVGGILSMINVAGGMLPDRCERGTQTGWHFPTVSSHIFTEVDSKKLTQELCSQMQALVSMHRYMPE